ncbi:NAD(P)H-quinone oxidoreductase subunit U, chloroplastic isoform X2 [Camellia sinensis]|uniref:NAD(P)H-quinone oxidoreductase subunit U, chloroplastic isoform X2 n=1 Tax=Camellia sinensis TaxID=4442 RepID=UPI001036AE36|nr:NAD(P)H-quinone oxidoreductase subunit U, chloroplastic isoform X2 [Camellia sinensis]
MAVSSSMAAAAAASVVYISRRQNVASSWASRRKRRRRSCCCPFFSQSRIITTAFPTKPPKYVIRCTATAITDVDHYGRLGIQKSCPFDQVYVAYKNKVEALMNEGVDEEALNKKLELLKESYSVLSNAQERRLYDWSLARSEKPDTYIWPFEVDTTKKSTESPPPQEPEDERPTTLVGYFMLGWFILAFTLSIALNLL